MSANLGRWVFIEENRPPRTDTNDLSDLIIIEPDALVFVDSESGVIKLSIKIDGPQLRINGGIYNPRKGIETLGALVDILKYIAHFTQKQVIYRTERVNKTEHLKIILTQAGFAYDGKEFSIEVDPNSIPEHQYAEMDEELNRLVLEKI